MSLVRFDNAITGRSLQFCEGKHRVAHNLDEVVELISWLDQNKGTWRALKLNYEAGYAWLPEKYFNLKNSQPQEILAEAFVSQSVNFTQINKNTSILSHKKIIEFEAMKFHPNKADYIQQVNDIIEQIYQGNIYQLNYTGRIPIHFSYLNKFKDLFNDPFSKNFDQDIKEILTSFYLQRLLVNPVPRAALWMGEEIVLSFSPELMFEVNDRTITSNPIKGTSPRSDQFVADRSSYDELKESKKDQAENWMIIDLVRNDLNKIASEVKVQEISKIIGFNGVWQSISKISGKLAEKFEWQDVFKALFPFASVTGVPKISAIEEIAKRETKRGAYTGAIGWISPDESAKFNVAIRTLTFERKKACGYFGVGGGIVADSDPQKEFFETSWKSQFLNEPLNLFETMRVINGRIPLLKHHAERLFHSCRSFGIPTKFDQLKDFVNAFSQKFSEKIPNWQKKFGSEFIICWSLATDSLMQLNARELTPLPKKYKLAPYRLDWYEKNASVWAAQTKSNQRKIYARAKDYAHSLACDDAILITEHQNQIIATETTIANVFILSSNQKWITSPVETGLLPGIFRQKILQRFPRVKETPIPYAWLKNPSVKIILANSVRGLWRATIPENAITNF